MKGIILAGGSGKRLFPLTAVVSKQLLPVYDKPMIYYPLSVLLLADIREVLIISTPEATPAFKKLLGDGSDLGCEFYYAVQQSPDGIAEAFLIGEKFIGRDRVALALGDNLFYGSGFGETLRRISRAQGATILAARVRNPKCYAVVQLGVDQEIISIQEKPKFPASNYVVPGLYFYDNDVIDIAKTISASERGEKEITSVNQCYLDENRLNVELLNRGVAWLDAGTFASLNEASTFVRVIEERQGAKIGCIEEVAYYRKFIDCDQLLQLSNRYDQSGYGEYLRSLVENE